MSGKSLMTDDDALYSQARSLYTTRNKVVHSGVVDEASSADRPMRESSFATAITRTLARDVSLEWVHERPIQIPPCANAMLPQHPAARVVGS